MCGRPLGLAWDPSKNDTMIVMDSSVGVLELNVKNKKLKRVIFNNEEVGREVMPTVFVYYWILLTLNFFRIHVYINLLIPQL